MKWIVPPALVVLGLTGSYVARGIQRGALPWWGAVITSLVGSVMWGLVSRTCADVREIRIASATFNALPLIGFAIGCVLSGDRLTPPYLVGLILMVCGAAVMAAG